MQGTNHHDLFEAVGRLPGRGLPEPCRQELDPFTLGMLGEFGRKSPLRTTFVLDTGRRLARACGAVVGELAGDVGLRVTEPWLGHWGEITRALGAFYWAGGDGPAMLWTHTLCWTDRAVQRSAGAEITTRRPVVAAKHPGRRVRLFFEARRWATIDTDKIRWLSPVPQVAGGYQLAKVVETRDTVWRGEPVSCGHREALGACGDVRADRRWLARSLYPGLEGRVYALWEDPAGGRTGFRTPPPWEGGGTTALSGGRPGRVVDDQGILDAQIVKAWRLSELAVLPGVRVAMVDELAFVLARSGEVAYVAATWDKLDRYVPAYGEDNWLGEWLADRR